MEIYTKEAFRVPAFHQVTSYNASIFACIESSTAFARGWRHAKSLDEIAETLNTPFRQFHSYILLM